MSYTRRYDGPRERLAEEEDRALLDFKFDTVLKEAGVLKPEDVGPYGEEVWEQLKEGE